MPDTTAHCDEIEPSLRRHARLGSNQGTAMTPNKWAAMNEEQALADIIQTLTADHGCHAVILYGSRARGDFQPTSDWDVAGICEAGATAPRRVARAFHGAW